MMTSFLKFELEDGTIVFVETAEPQKSSGGLIPTSHNDNLAEQSPLAFEKSFSPVQKMAASIMKNLHNGFEIEPDEVSISFGVKASTEVSNLMISRGGEDNNFDITLRWRKAKEEE
jgi:hypothetical protein